MSYSIRTELITQLLNLMEERDDRAFLVGYLLYGDRTSRIDAAIIALLNHRAAREALQAAPDLEEELIQADGSMPPGERRYDPRD